MLNQLDSLRSLIEPEMYKHIERWPGGSYEEWENNVDRLRNFITRRCGAWANNKLDSCYNLSGPYNVTFNADPSETASLKVNSIVVNQLPWEAAYFGGIDVNLKAINNKPEENSFYQWTSEYSKFESPVKNIENSFRIEKNDKIIAHFDKKSSVVPEIENNNKFAVYPTQVCSQLKIEFNLVSKSEVSVGIFSLDGRKVGDLFSGIEERGPHLLNYEMSSSNLLPGVYLIRLTNNNNIEHAKIIFAP